MRSVSTITFAPVLTLVLAGNAVADDPVTSDALYTRSATDEQRKTLQKLLGEPYAFNS